MKPIQAFGCLVLAVVMTASLGGQVEHAPTVSQCRADQRMWSSRLEESSPEQLPRWAVLSEWRSEMGDCEKVDPSNHWTYYNASSEVLAAQGTRMMDFLGRHDLYGKFLQEDAAGKR